MKNYRIKKLSLSRARSKARYKKAYEAQDQQLIDEFGYIPCSSCGINLHTGCRSWGHSHNIPIGQRSDLECDPKNFRPRCQDFGNHKGCHEKLDNHDFEEIVKFKDLTQIMEYRKQNDRHAYNTFVQGLKSVGCKDYDYLD